MKSKWHEIRRLKWMCRLVACALPLLCALPSGALAQRVVRNGMAVERFDGRVLSLDFYVEDFDFEPTAEGYLLLTSPAANGYSREAGKPMLPQLRQLLELPCDGAVVVRVEEADWQRCALPEGEAVLAPASAARPKSAAPTVGLPAAECYGRDACYALPLAELTPLGRMRSLRVARLTLSPFRYNPVRGELEVCRHCRVVVRFEGKMLAHSAATAAEAPLADLPLLRPMGTKQYRNALCDGSQPPVYMVVAPQQYAATLEPLLHWKRQEGYDVETHYFENESREALQAFLQARYDEATPLRPAPLMLLLVGDHGELPAWMGRHTIAGLDYHRTDLYYAEYTGDYLPDLLVGRLSVGDTAELRAVVEKTLAYERFELDDSSYLSRSLLVAGKEDTPPAPTVTNGQVNYLKQYLVALDAGHDTFCYYNPASDTLGDSIRRHLVEGIGLMNYSAHCNLSGWRYPLLLYSDIDTMTANGCYFLAINNCCRTNEIVGNCFGEHLLRKAGGGAIGAIGASNETLWDEDYCWSVGYGGEATLHPVYHEGQPGAYDRLFHTHQEPVSGRVQCQSQIVAAGNWAVTQSGSPYDAFYWEIYSLLGDPSLMPYIGVPAALAVEADTVVVGDAEVHVQGPAGACVAATCGDTLLGRCLIDSTGRGLIECRRVVTDSLTLTATAQYCRPWQASLTAQPCGGARLVVREAALQSPDGEPLERLTLGDSALLRLTLRNVGQQTATQHRLCVSPEADDTDTLLLTVASLLPQADTIVTLRLFPYMQREPRLVVLHCACGDSVAYWQQRLRYDLMEADTTQPEDSTQGVVHVAEPQPEVYPNPASSSVVLSGFERETQVELYDLLGRCLWRRSVQPQERVECPVAQLPAGLYSLRFVGERADGRWQQTVKRLIVKR